MKIQNPKMQLSGVTLPASGGRTLTLGGTTCSKNSVSSFLASRAAARLGSCVSASRCLSSAMSLRSSSILMASSSGICWHCLVTRSVRDLTDGGSQPHQRISFSIQLMKPSSAACRISIQPLIAYPGRRPRCGLALGYYLLAFQAVSWLVSFAERVVAKFATTQTVSQLSGNSGGLPSVAQSNSVIKDFLTTAAKKTDASKRIHSIPNPIARKFNEFQPHPFLDAELFPISSVEGVIRRT